MTKRLLIIACLTCAAMPLKLSALCMMRPTCEHLATTDLVFIAEVLEAKHVSPITEPGTLSTDGITAYRFNVLEGLKGIKAGEFSAQFYYGSERQSFVPGHRYVIFAKRTATGIYDNGCSLTREITTIGEREWLPTMRTELGLCLKTP